MGEGKVGIVIPAYNAENFLKECLDSVLQQSYKNLVIALANDGSIDKTWDIITEFVIGNPNIIRAINSINKGVMQERAACIELLNDCDYIVFVDSDDALCDERIIEKCIAEFVENDADMVCFNATHGIKPIYKISQKLLYDKEQALRAILIQEYMDGNMWGAVYKYGYVKKCFKAQECNNDDYINKAAFIKACNKIVILPDIGYFYRLNEQSQTHTKVKEKDYMYYEHVCAFCKALLKEYPKFGKECAYFRAWVLLWLATNLSKYAECTKMRIYDPVMEELRKECITYMFNPYFSVKSRVTFILIRMGIFATVYNIYHRIRNVL